jgi:hypothetical protein
MLKGLFEAEREKPQVFQVLLIRNDASQEVEVQEDEEVDFLRIEEHLKQGGSIFITSKNAQKFCVPKENEKIPKHDKMRTFTTFYIDHV